jgi:hypothetical protein
MEKKMLFSVVWTAGFPVVYMLFSMLMFGVLGKLGLGQGMSPDPTKMTPGLWGIAVFGMIWASLFWASPLVGLVLSILGVLPGTRRKREIV